MLDPHMMDIGTHPSLKGKTMTDTATNLYLQHIEAMTIEQVTESLDTMPASAIGSPAHSALVDRFNAVKAPATHARTTRSNDDVLQALAILDDLIQDAGEHNPELLEDLVRGYHAIEFFRVMPKKSA